MARRGKYGTSGVHKPRCPYDGKVVMSKKHAMIIEERDNKVAAYTCQAGYWHVGNKEKHNVDLV